MYTFTTKKEMNRESANATRLRVNRIGLIQQIDVQELLPKLVRARIISYDTEVPKIMKGTSSIDQARCLIDCLLDSKGENRVERPANWYLQFRSMLLENSSAYGNLVAALDNTVIRVPEFSQRVADAFIDKTNNERSNQFRSEVNQQMMKISEPKHEEQTVGAVLRRDNQEQITKIEFDRYTMNKIIIEGQFQKVIDNLTYRSQVGGHEENIFSLDFQ